jgi:phosphodiesterase/alkaline phosphatase D-like protein
VKRVLLRLVLALLGLGSLFLPLLDDPPLQSGAYVQDVRATSAVIAMVTATPEVLHAEVNDTEDGRPMPVAEPVGAVRRHLFHVTGLKPGAKYAFRVFVEFKWAREEGSFRTPPADDKAPVRFCAFGDSGDQPWWVWLQTSPLFYWPAR